MQGRNIAELSRILEKELTAVKNLISLSLRKKECLLKSDHENLAETVTEFEKELQKLLNMEEERKKITVKVAKEYKMENPNLKEIIKIAGNEAERLEKIRNELNSSLKKLTKINYDNAYLISSHLSLLNEVINVIAKREEEVYSKSGKLKVERNILEGKA